MRDVPNQEPTKRAFVPFHYKQQSKSLPYKELPSSLSLIILMANDNLENAGASVQFQTCKCWDNTRETIKPYIRERSNVSKSRMEFLYYV